MNTGHGQVWNHRKILTVDGITAILFQLPQIEVCSLLARRLEPVRRRNPLKKSADRMFSGARKKFAFSGMV
jgi:hypothetical protein